MKKGLLTIFMIAIMVLLAACGGNNDNKNSTRNDIEDTNVETVEVQHELDKSPVSIKKNPETVVVFDFGILDTLDTLGIEVAGLPQANVPKYLSKYDDETKYASLGSLKEPDFEAIHALKPDVIFISTRQADLYKEFSEIAPTVYVGLDYAHYMDSFKHNMNLVGEIFGLEDEVKVELANIDERIKNLHAKASSEDANALIVLGSEGKASAYGPNSRFGLIHDIFGYKAADTKIEVSTHGQNITYEYILETNPDILFVIDRDAAVGGDASAKDSIENELVMKTNAYKNGKIFYLNAEYWYLSGGGLQSMSEMVIEIEASVE